MNSLRQTAPTELAAPRPQTQVEAWMKELSGAVDGLRSAVDRHAEKLEPVLRVQEPSKGEVAPPDEMLVPLADQIRMQVKRISTLRENVENLTGRVEA